MQRTDMLLPGRQPIEGFEGGAIGNALEAPPVGFDLVEVSMDGKTKLRRDFAKLPAPLRERHGQGLVGRVRRSKCRQCGGGAYHSITARKEAACGCVISEK